MPTSADRLIIEFRNWFDKYCGGKLPWQEVGILPPEVLPMNLNRQQSIAMINIPNIAVVVGGH